MRASIKYHHLNNIKADLQDRKMSPLVSHHKLIWRYTELRNRKKIGEHCLYPALVYHFWNDSSRFLFLYCESLGLKPKSRLYGSQGHFLIPYQTLMQSAVQQAILTYHVHNITSQKGLEPMQLAKLNLWQPTLEEDFRRHKDISCTHCFS